MKIAMDQTNHILKLYDDDEKYDTVILCFCFQFICFNLSGNLNVLIDNSSDAK